jgi:hypothetical protein
VIRRLVIVYSLTRLDCRLNPERVFSLDRILPAVLWLSSQQHSGFGTSALRRHSAPGLERIHENYSRGLQLAATRDLKVMATGLIKPPQR